ncbi:DUF6873 family GME fold protein [Haloimpatiens sp. FM7330]|uniref:DUF6873 family GME fold protein n=1 Tax=Haloimpatiens sp. FM7330 TaxID=3298610 RepID=UPI003642BBEC
MKNFVIVDSRIDMIEKNSLLKLGYKVLYCPICSNLYDAVCGHPDMLIHIIDNKNIMVHKDMDISFTNKLKLLGYNILYSNYSLQSKYPKDISLNAVNLKHIFMHYIMHTDPILLQYMNNKKILNVNQGYTKCSTAIVSNSAIITSDSGIYNTLKNENIDMLLLPPGDIILPGLNYGFIGGTCGLLDKNTLAFYGDLNYYTYGKEVLHFLKKHNVKPVFLRKGPLVDRGSILRLP